MNDYASVTETARRWGVSPRYVQRLAAEGRVPGARRYGNYWMLPPDAEKPGDPRRSPSAAAPVLFYAAFCMPRNRPETGVDALEEPLRPLALADIAFRRGDPAPAKRVWREMRGGREGLTAGSLAIAAAISSGDYALYDEIRYEMNVRIAAERDPRSRRVLSLPGVSAAVSMAAPGLTPEWLKQGDFSGFPCELRPFLLYLYAMHLRNIGAFSEMLGVAGAALALCQREDSFTWMDVYLHMLCACAASNLQDDARLERHLSAALALALPCGFLAPLADYLGELGGRLEAEIGRRRPEYVPRVVELWNSSFNNWMRFHNRFTRENIATVLTAREYHIARLIAHGASYAETARLLKLSVSRIKDILAEIYAKLSVCRRSELEALIR